jgi:dTDP-4-dehydrorhamnose 3,5-epimerase-like enzyme
MKNPQIIQFPKINDPRGNLTFLQNLDQIPFEIKRIFWTYDVPAGEIRGGHAYKLQNEIIIALSGSFDVVITSKNNSKQVFSLNRSNFGLYIPNNYWRHIENFSTNSVVLHISDQFFKEEDYIKNIEYYNKTF